MPTYEYICEQCEEISTTIRRISERTIDHVCPSCGGEAHYIISAPMTKLDGTDPSFPGAWHSWERKREQKMKQERKNMRNHGTER